MDLRITEIFLSIQGESSHAGRPCSFVRLTGCPMRCVWCDSEYTFTGGQTTSFDKIFSRLEEFSCPLVLVKGGKPLEQADVAKAIAAAKEKLGNDGRLVIRPSGTEPVIRVMAEGDDRQLVEQVVEDICEAVAAAA